MKLKVCFALFIVFILLVGCSSNEEYSGNDVPSDISEENYEKFVEEYETYEERVRESDGEYLSSDSERGLATDLYDIAWESRKKVDNGEDAILTTTEDELLDNFTTLYALKENEDTAYMFINDTKYDEPSEYAIILEENIIDTLELDKNSITAEMVNGDNDFADNNDTSEANEELNPDYEPEFFNPTEWDNCINSQAYTVEECIDIDEYYASEEGQRELQEAEKQQEEELEADIQEEVELEERHQREMENEEKQQQIDDIYGSQDDSEVEEEITEPEYNKVEGLESTLQSISDLLYEVQSINSDALALEISEEDADETIRLLSEETESLSSIIDNPEANNHLGEDGMENIEKIISSLEEVIASEDLVIDDPMSTQNIQAAEATVSDAISIIGIISY
ncbi:hypothetical protein [Oceanobacillus locisalsi]|uniref:Uncharacterized protein n=1 Tax=Oceanobacillus locisalsi TaxID=546107 RepID=A0ABW3NJT1_9BACI